MYYYFVFCRVPDCGRGRGPGADDALQRGNVGQERTQHLSSGDARPVESRRRRRPDDGLFREELVAFRFPSCVYCAVDATRLLARTIWSQL